MSKEWGCEIGCGVWNVIDWNGVFIFVYVCYGIGRVSVVEIVRFRSVDGAVLICVYDVVIVEGVE